MKSTDGSETAKRRAAERAAEAVDDGMVVGLGTGSTAAHAIRALGWAVEAGLDVRGVATSYASAALAREVGLPLTTLEDEARVDVAIDGADQFAGFDLIKGGGAAHAREKLVAGAADRFLVVVDRTKEAPVLDRSVPVEVLPSGRATVAAAVREHGGTPVLRAAERKDGPVITDNGNVVLDCDFGEIDDPGALAATLSSIPGIVEHGLFVDVVDAIYVGADDDVDVRHR